MRFLTDTHCHLDSPDFEHDLDQVLLSSRQAGIRKILIPGIDLYSCKRSINLSKKHEKYLYAAVGIHPNSTNMNFEDIKSIKKLINDNKVVAIGEIGLDFYRKINNPQDQIFLFEKMLDIAHEFKLPVCLHNRDSDDEILKILDKWFDKLEKSRSFLLNKPGVFHSFGGSAIISKWAIEHHFLLGISGAISYQNAINLQQSVKDLDIEHFVIETDAPYQSPNPYRGKRNEPKNIRVIAEKISEIKSITFQEIVDQTNQNAEQLFGWQD